MRIGLTGGASTVDKMVEQATRAEADGFTSLWYASAIAGDPLVAMAVAGRATSTIELGTSVLQTYTCHPRPTCGRRSSRSATTPVRPVAAAGRC
jgi:alkanesulfonate monooxygenase SsuD/methylene tetrahydromethanopterin reductase-like flavin-dependent oxidoreductase (luciferase family)